MQKNETFMPPIDIPIAVDSKVAELSLKVPPHWHQRALYLGIDGANAWIDVVRSNNYLLPADREQLKNQIVSVTRGLSVKTFISFGSGDAEMDKEITINLTRENVAPIYIPVDINNKLLRRAITILSNYTSVPLGILGDFEDGFQFVSDQLGQYVQLPILAALLGNTLGNIEGYEKHFLTQLKNWLNPGDFVLLDVTIVDEKWTELSDIRLSHAGHFDEMRRFYAKGLNRQSRIPPEEFLLHYEERVTFEPDYTDVPYAHALNVVDLPTHTTILSLRRYRWENFLSWLTDEFGFEVIAEQRFYFAGEHRGAGAVLLRC
ncbi:MAG TPA: hypothetical protein DCF68_09365 [Cyanothece sp. UBA12306]|nr:hypothetical protein [Cyanothece sp. UBA12306]